MTKSTRYFLTGSSMVVLLGLGTGLVAYYKGDLPMFIAALQHAGMECHATDEDVMRVFVPSAIGDNGQRDQQAIFSLAAERRVQVRHLRPSVPTLEDVFAKAVGEE